MQKKSYDVVIVGAGVSGLMLAKLLNKSKLKVLLIEKRNTIKSLANHRYGTFGKTVKKFRLEKYVIKDYASFSFISPNKLATKKYSSKKFQVVDMNRFAQNLKLKCEILTNYEIKKVVRKNNAITIDNKITSKIIVDCSGDQKIIASKLNLLNKVTTDMYCTALELENCNIPSDELDWFAFMANLKYSNVGLWYYPYSATTCQIGIADFVSKKISVNENKTDLIKYYQHIEPFKTYLKNSVIKEEVIKIGPTTELTTFVDDNFLACGDASGAGTPLVGEGFRIALEMADSAYKTINQAFLKKSFSKKSLLQHQANFHKISKYYKWSTLIRFLLLRVFTNKTYDIFTKNLNTLTKTEYSSALKSEINFPIANKIINFKLVGNILGNIFKNKNKLGYKIKQNAKI